ncbi:MAG: hypothetical protein P8J86_00440 [Phycisphaerales bacterium]|jgi:hypothetical protein|nr:hypothetical protein [Phycisphaerales bacterium]
MEPRYALRTRLEGCTPDAPGRRIHDRAIKDEMLETLMDPTASKALRWVQEMRLDPHSLSWLCDQIDEAQVIVD